MPRQIVLGCCAVGIVTFSLFAQSPSVAPAPVTGVRAEFLTELSVTETHMLQLAEAIPESKFTWRPAAGVRSISEVLLHVAAANGEKKLPWLGGQNTRRGILFFMTRHSAEHMAQLISYARMNGTTPPWNEPGEAPKKS